MLEARLAKLTVVYVDKEVTKNMNATDIKEEK